LPAAPEQTIAEQADPGAQGEALLRELMDAYALLSALGKEQRACLSRADGPGVERCAVSQVGLAQRIAELDRRRQVLCGGAGVAISAWAERLPGPAGARLKELAGRARELIARVHREYRVVHQATLSLVTHVDGIVQQVARRLSPTGAYGPCGRVQPGRGAAGGLDLTY
jgi:FlgN protein